MADSYYNINFFSKEQIKELNNYIENNYLLEESKDNQASIDGESIKHTKTLVINRYFIQNMVSRLEQYVHYVNENHFGYDLFPFNNHDSCLLNIYKAENQGRYDYHIDSSRDGASDVKLTVLANLSMQEYKGGIFKIFNGNEYEIPQISQPGSVLVFKSYLNHKVTPITYGERRTLTIFGRGPRFR